MKNLKDFINESLLMEGKTDYAFVWDHYNPSTVYCLNGATNALNKVINDYDFNINIIRIKSNICGIMWNDEYLAAEECDGNNLNAAKAGEIKKLQAQIDSEDNDETYKYLECSMFVGGNEWFDDDAKSNNAKDYLDKFIEMIEDSEVSGDSGYGRAVIDIKNGETLLAGNVQVVFMSANEFLENIKSKSE